MGDVMLIFLIHNVLIFCIIFWLLTWGAEYFFTKKPQLAKKQFYECGFKSISELNIQVNYNFFMLAVFLILYDIEFTFLYPFLFNFSKTSVIEFFFFLVFMSFIIMSLYYDWVTNTLSWNVE